ncbi:MAG: hypothetical protein IK134_10320 [Oscillospiraceae bacterium]|nr:hypothetical protein [Oscillospiraceae bacterium]
MFIFRRFAEFSSYFRVCYILWIFSEQNTRYSVSMLKAEHSLYIFQRAGSPRLHFLKRIVCETVSMRLLRSFTIIMLPIDARRRPNRRSPCNAYSQALARVQKTSIDLLSHGFSFGAESAAGTACAAGRKRQ